MEEQGKTEEAGRIFLEAWQEATNDSEKFLSAYYLARCQDNASDRLKWYETALELALKINDDTVNSALPALYTNIAKCQEEVGKEAEAKKSYDLAASLQHHPSDKGPFYHGTKADLQVGDLLVAGHVSNYQSELQMNHIYFTALANGAGLAAALAKGDGRERVYVVEPAGSFENDPNVTDKKFPGNPTRSYRTAEPLKIVGEVNDWVRLPANELQKFKEKLDNSKGEIIN